jgi:hypothetical protein
VREDNIHYDIEQFLRQNNADPKVQVLTDNEIEILIIALAEYRQSKGDGTFSEEDAVKVIDWAQNVRLGATVLDLVLEGLALVNWDGAQNDVTFTISDEGREAVERFK